MPIDLGLSLIVLGVISVLLTKICSMTFACAPVSILSNFVISSSDKIGISKLTDLGCPATVAGRTSVSFTNTCSITFS